MPKLAGRFFFKQTNNGNLLGEFSNNQGPDVSTESCDIIGCHTHPFLGDYHSTWQENGTAVFSKLSITPKPNAPKLFVLHWTGATNFHGEAMVCDSGLVGDYRMV